jgi:hypothetical protein
MSATQVSTATAAQSRLFDLDRIFFLIAISYWLKNRAALTQIVGRHYHFETSVPFLPST